MLLLFAVIALILSLVSLYIYIMPPPRPLFTQFSNVTWWRTRIPDRTFVKNKPFSQPSLLGRKYFKKYWKYWIMVFIKGGVTCGIFIKPKFQTNINILKFSMTFLFKFNGPNLIFDTGRGGQNQRSNAAFFLRILMQGIVKKCFPYFHLCTPVQFDVLTVGGQQYQ